MQRHPNDQKELMTKMSADGFVEKTESFKGVVKMKYYGKYRGQVTDNKDPNQIGRIKAKVPDVLGTTESGWAVPCVPYAGKNVGFQFIPPVGAKVWIEFEKGDSDHPIWSGGFWESGEMPEASADPSSVKLIKTNRATITLSDLSGAESLTIEGVSGLKIVMDANGIELINGGSRIKITATRVSVNDGALEVI